MGITFDGEEITAYAASDTSEYAIVYGKNSKGVTGWFQLDLTDGSFQRFNTEDIELVPTPTPTPSPTPTPTPEPTATLSVRSISRRGRSSRRRAGWGSTSTRPSSRTRW